MRTRYVALVFLLLLTLMPIVKASEEIYVYFFYSKTCSHCADEKIFLDELEEKYARLIVKRFDISSNHALMTGVANTYDTKSTNTPLTFIGNKAFVGFAEGDAEIFDKRYNAYVGYSELIEKTIDDCLTSGDCTEEIILTTNKTLPTPTGGEPNSIPSTPLNQTFIYLPVIGAVSLEHSMTVLGAALGFVDGALNPCALSVIFFLFAYLMSIGSRKRALLIGIAYSLTVFLMYSLFMYGALNVLHFVGQLTTIKFLVGMILLVAGGIQVKDFFFYGRGPSLEIPSFAKPKIERLIKMATIPSAILLGVLVSLAEIPCAGVFPFVYITILTERISSPALNIFYLLWYNVFFVAPLLVLTFIFGSGMIKVEDAEKARLEKRRWMRLISGTIMILLGVWMLMR